MPHSSAPLTSTDQAHGLPDAEHTALGLRYRSIQLSTGHISYVDEGSGPSILLLHGAPITSLGFVRVVRGLKPHHRVIAPDLPGFGYSTCHENFEGSLDDYARFVEEFCKALRLRHFYLYLNDSSCCIGMVAASSLASDVSGLVVASTVPVPLTGAAWFVKIALKHLVSSRPVRWLNRHFNLLPWMVSTLAPLLNPFTVSERKMLRRQFSRHDQRDRLLDLLEHMGRDEPFMERAARVIRDTFRDTPTLLLYGQFDPMRIIGGVRHYKRAFQNSTVHIVPREEHFPILSSGAQVAAVVRRWIVDVESSRERASRTPSEVRSTVPRPLPVTTPARWEYSEDLAGDIRGR